MTHQINFQNKLNLIESWWNRQNDRALVSYVRSKKQGKDFSYIPLLLDGVNKYWPDADSEPDYEGYAGFFAGVMKNMDTGDYLPSMTHTFGARGTPMTLAFYLGGNVKFQSETVWTDAVVDRWEDFEIKFNPDNIWWKRSLKLVEASCRLLHKDHLVWLPDFGDAMTCFSLLRGPEKLVFDLIDNKKVMQKALSDFIVAWKQYHNACWEIFRQYYPGDCSWLAWAPGKTYAVQSDFSTLLSPEMFKDYVVPELEGLSDYLEYMIFHLDGPDEVKFLDMLLDLPFVKAIQWVPGAGNPTASHWLDMLKKIQARQKSLYLLSESAEETKFLKKELSPRGLWIYEWFGTDKP